MQPATSAANLRYYEVIEDGDGDGLSDLWETSGIDIDNDGVIDLPLNLPPYNADPNHRDVFVEMDYMTCTLSPGGCAPGAKTSQAPQPGAVDDVVAAFAAAPLSNPDGTTGVRLHVDVDEAIHRSSTCHSIRWPVRTTTTRTSAGRGGPVQRPLRHSDRTCIADLPEADTGEGHGIPLRPVGRLVCERLRLERHRRIPWERLHGDHRRPGHVLVGKLAGRVAGFRGRHADARARAHASVSAMVEPTIRTARPTT